MTVANFHSFCNRILTESAPDAGLPPNPDVLDGVGQLLLLRDIRPQLPLVYHNDWWLPQFVAFINRAKDELVTPADFEAFVAEERRVFEERYGPYDAAAERLEKQGNLSGPREVRKAYANLRRHQRADEEWDRKVAEPSRPPDPSELADAFRPDLAAVAEQDVEKTADREARRAVSGIGRAQSRGQFDDTLHPQIDALAETYVADGAALEVMRLTELATVYRAYQTELVRRGALDYGEQIAAVSQVFKARPNVLRRWQRQFRYLLVDEFQDANIAQIELIEMLGRTPDRPDNVMVVGDDDQSIYRFRGASFAAFTEFDTRFSQTADPRPDRPSAGPAAASPDRAELPLERERPDDRQPPDRQKPGPLRARQAPADRSARRSAGRAHRLRRPGGRGGRHRRRDPRPRRRGAALVGCRGPLSQAQAPRRDRGSAARRGHPVHGGRRAVAVRDARDPRPRAVPPGDRRRVRRRRPDPDDDRRPVAARRARDPPRRPDGQVRPAPPHRRDPRDRRHRRAQDRRHRADRRDR